MLMLFTVHSELHVYGNERNNLLFGSANYSPVPNKHNSPSTV